MSQASTQRSKVADRTETVLLSRVADRDRVALGELYALYHPRLFKFVFRLTSSYTIADELVNDVMMVVWQKADSFRGDSRVSTWIFGVAYRLAMRRLTRNKMHLFEPLADTEVCDGIEATIELEDWVLGGISALSTAQQLAVVLVFYLGLSYEETAQIAGCPTNTIKTRMYHARKKLKESLRVCDDDDSSQENMLDAYSRISRYAYAG